MWYKIKEDNGIDFGLPIIAETEDGAGKYLLIPQLDIGYAVKGFNWLGLNDGKYGSCECFKTAKDAITAWSEYTIYNAVIEASEI